MANFVKNAMESVANWNKQMNQERKEKRTAFFDMQTFAMHYPMTGRGRMEVVKKPSLGHYPIALIPGQFVDHYDQFSPGQLKYLPLNTALKAPPTNKRLSELGRKHKVSRASKRQVRGAYTIKLHIYFKNNINQASESSLMVWQCLIAKRCV